MGFLKKYWLIIAIVLPVAILVLIRSLGGSHFRPDTKKWAEPSFDQSNVITMAQIETISGEKLFINLDDFREEINVPGFNTLIIPSDSILNKKYINTIRKHAGPIFIRSSEVEVLSRIWMILSQMGIRNIYIVSDDADNEVMKYKFLSISQPGNH